MKMPKTKAKRPRPDPTPGPEALGPEAGGSNSQDGIMEMLTVEVEKNPILYDKSRNYYSWCLTS